jgi:hypothetical protein
MCDAHFSGELDLFLKGITIYEFNCCLIYAALIVYVNIKKMFCICGGNAA